jgi:4-amino-4-deoxy-L-arabinose transferase-like glycosyltransferase
MTEVRVDRLDRERTGPTEAGLPADARAGRGLLAWALPVITLITLGLTLYFRIAGPSNIYDKDQSKTIAYTADIVRNGRWALPYDMIMQPATKPPLYNWISAVISGPLDLWTELALKLPAMLAGIAIVGLIVLIGERMLQRAGAMNEPPDPSRAAGLGWLAAIIWLASWSASELIYLARPDMLLTALLIGAWVCGTVALETDDPRRRRPVQIGFWLCVTGAILTKGPPALLAFVYVGIASKLIYGSWRTLGRIGWGWGLPLCFGIVLLWAFFAYRQEPEYFGEGLLMREGINRIFGGGPERIVPKSFKVVPRWFLRDFWPWGYIALAAVFFVKPTRWPRHPLAPAALWATIIVLSMAVSKGKRADYLAPAYPAAAILAAFVIARVNGWRPWLPIGASLAAVVLAISPTQLPNGLKPHWSVSLGLTRWQKSPEATTRHGEHAKAFARDVKAVVGDDPNLVVLVSSYHPLLTLMGRHAGNKSSVAETERARWVIAPENPRWNPVLVSQQLPSVRKREPGRMALYDRTAHPLPTFENLMELYAEREINNVPALRD